MAKKKPSIAGLFERTEPQPGATDPEAEREAKAKARRPIGVYLRKDARAEIERIAQAEGLSRHSLLAYAVSYFIRQYKAGKVKIETTKKTTLKLDI